MFDKDPKDIIQFVLIFLPGFLCLALAKSIVDFEFTEFEFIYVGIALSIVIFLASDLSGRTITHRVIGGKKANESDEKFLGRRRNASQWTMIGLILPVTVLVAWFLGITVQNDLITATMRNITPNEILKKYRGRPQYVVFKSHHDCKMWEHDSRPADIKDNSGTEITYPPSHKNWVRIRGESGSLYEGFPETFQISGKESEFYLSPACRVRKSDKESTPSELVTPILGPGVLVYGKDILSIEFIDTRDSKCYFSYYRTTETKACN